MREVEARSVEDIQKEHDRLDEEQHEESRREIETAIRHTGVFWPGDTEDLSCEPDTLA